MNGVYRILQTNGFPQEELHLQKETIHKIIINSISLMLKIVESENMSSNDETFKVNF